MFFWVGSDSIQISTPDTVLCFSSAKDGMMLDNVTNVPLAQQLPKASICLPGQQLVMSLFMLILSSSVAHNTPSDEKLASSTQLPL